MRTILTRDERREFFLRSLSRRGYDNLATNKLTEIKS